MLFVRALAVTELSSWAKYYVSVYRFRAMRRIPAVVWRHRGNGAVIARSSQPEVGWLGWRSSEDERLLAALGSACGADPGLAPPTNKVLLKNYRRSQRDLILPTAPDNVINALRNLRRITNARFQ